MVVASWFLSTYGHTLRRRGAGAAAPTGRRQAGASTVAACRGSGGSRRAASNGQGGDAAAPAVSPWIRTSSIAREDWSKRRRRRRLKHAEDNTCFSEDSRRPLSILYLDRMTLKIKKQLVGSRISKPPPRRVSSSPPLIYPAHRSRAAVSIFRFDGLEK